jgi:Phage integrase family
MPSSAAATPVVPDPAKGRRTRPPGRTTSRTKCLIRIELFTAMWSLCTGLEPMTQHDMRHWCATLLIGMGTPIPVAAKILGHADPSITARLYAHVISEAERTEVEKLTFFPGSRKHRPPIDPQMPSFGIDPQTDPDDSPVPAQPTKPRKGSVEKGL